MTRPSDWNRREILTASAWTAAGLALAPWLQSARADDAGAARKKVLFFTKSSGFQHSVITRSAEDPTKLAFAEQLLTDWGKNNGFDVTCSKDGNVFAPDSIGQFDVFVFYTTGDLTKDSDKHETKKNAEGKQEQGRLLWKEPGMPPGAKEAFLDAIHNGKGFMGFHCAADTFHSPAHASGNRDFSRDVNAQGQDEFDPYIRMLGGEFIIHGQQQEATLKAIDPDFPGARALDKARFVEEWYSLKNFAPDLHVILAQDCTGMTGAMYQRPMYPETWARMHGKGRVFYTSLGHREDVWQKPEFASLTLGALKWTTGRVEADVTPNLKTATPDAEPAAKT
jgi:type 1 glutamine amidotransferase